MVDQQDWVGTRHTYYKMRELFLDRRKNIARSPHAPMLLSDATRRDAKRRDVASGVGDACIYVLARGRAFHFKQLYKFSASDVATA